MSDRTSTNMSASQIAKLILLSIVWGGAFLFSGMAVEYVHPLWVVTIRVGLAAGVMLMVLKAMGLVLPTTGKEWLAYLGMGMLNNVIPFAAIFYAQTFISVSLASIINAMTPVFAFLVLASFGVDRLTGTRIVGALVGVMGTALLFGNQLSLHDSLNLGLLLGLAAALSYAFAGLWGKLYLIGQAPVKSATSQLICSTAAMFVIVTFMQVPLPETMPPMSIIAALLGLAIVSTAFAYVLFFDIMANSGPANAMLVTLLIPISGSFFGWLVMGDQLTMQQIIGALVIAAALLIIDGRLFNGLRPRSEGLPRDRRE